MEIGQVGRNVMNRVRQLRELQRLSHRELSARLRHFGRPILPSGISKIESGDRRVDVDDLVALAGALGVHPNTLLANPADEPSGRTPDEEFTLEECFMELEATWEKIRAIQARTEARAAADG